MAVSSSSKQTMEPSCSSAAQSSRSSPTMAAKQDNNASSETSFVQSSENDAKRNAEKKNADVFSARSEEYRLLFRLPSDEVLVKDFNCALQENILIQAHELLKKNEARHEGSSAHDISRIQDKDVRFHGSELGETSEKLHQTLSLAMQEFPSDVDYLKPKIEDAVQKRLSWPNFGISIIRETWVASITYLKSENHLLLVLDFVGLAAALILMQMSNIVLLIRAPDVHVVTRGSSIGGPDWYGIENIEWLEKRFIYLKEEMVMVETRLEKLHHEHAILKMHLQSFEQAKHKS